MIIASKAMVCITLTIAYTVVQYHCITVMQYSDTVMQVVIVIVIVVIIIIIYSSDNRLKHQIILHSLYCSNCISYTVLQQLYFIHCVAVIILHTFYCRSRHYHPSHIIRRPPSRQSHRSLSSRNNCPARAHTHTNTHNLSHTHGEALSGEGEETRVCGTASP